MRIANMPIHEFLALTDDERDTFPLGVVRLTSDGVILAFNQAESRSMNVAPQRALGKNYFRELAPCAAVKEFEGRFHDLAARRESCAETFGFFYTFAGDHRQVRISLIKGVGIGADVFVVTAIEPVTST